VDTYCSFDKQYKLLKAISKYSDMATTALTAGVPMKDILALQSKDELAKVKFEENFDETLDVVLKKMDSEFAKLGGN
jgi:V/A-type H+-transporting ATPase subunit A